MFDREEKQTELNKLLWRRALPAVLVILLDIVVVRVSLGSYLNPELENCLGRVLEVKALGCPEWFSNTISSFGLGISIVSFTVGGLAACYFYLKLLPQIKQVRTDLADSSG
mgnify:CR=1 FL=1